MVQRTSQELNLNTGGTVGVASSNIGNAAPDPNKYRTGTVYDAPGGAEDGTMTRILSKIVGVGDKLADQAIAHSQEEAYLKGMAQAGTIKSEADLQSDPVTRDWATAGYRDTMGRIQAADVEADIAGDMNKMREVSPEKFSEYLAQKRSTLIDSWSGMSDQARKAMFAQQMLNERAWVKKHAAAHAKFIVDTEMQSVKTGLDTSLASLDAARSDSSVYPDATKATLGTAYQAIVANPKLPSDVKGKMVSEFATYALEKNHQGLYDAIHNTPLPMADGKERPMASLMSWEDEVALSKAYRTSQERTAVFKNSKWADNKAAMEADWENPETPFMPESEVEKVAQEGMQLNAMNTEQYASFKKAYYSHMEKKIVQTGLAAAYQAGDQDKILRLDKTSDEALTAWVKTVGSKQDLPTAVAGLMQIGRNTGQMNAYRKAGELMAPAFAQLGTADKIDPKNAVTVANMLDTLDKAEAAGQQGAYQQFISALSPETQAKVGYIRDSRKGGSDATASIAYASTRVVEDQKMDPAMRTALVGAKSTELTKAIGEMAPLGLVGKLWLNVKSMVGTKDSRAEASSELAVRPEAQWFENKDRLDNLMANPKLQVSLKAQDIVRKNPYLSSDSVMRQAMADVAGRTVMSKWGPIVVPDGMTPQRFFGVTQDVSSERIGKALDEFVKPTNGGRMIFSVDPNGQTWAQEYGDKNQPLAGKVSIDRAQIAPMVEHQQARLEAKVKGDYGSGVKAQVGNVTLQYNGDNTAGLDNGWVRGLRDDLTSNGSLQISPDNKLPPATISAAFVYDTDRASKAAAQAMKLAGVQNEAAYKVFGSLAFSGDVTDKNNGQLIKAVAQKNPELAKQALERNPAYRNSDQTRKTYLMNNLLNIFKG